MHASAVLELEMVSSGDLVCATSHAAGGTIPDFNRPSGFELIQPRLLMSYNTLSQVAQAEFDQLISGEGLVMPIISMATLQMSINNSSDPRVQFSVVSVT